MSPRAACRLASLGFEQVCDYVAGKVDWLARGLPTEGRPRERRAGDVARDDVATCALDERVGDVRSRIERSPYGFALVLSGDRTVFGRLRRQALDGDPELTAEDVMEAGPSTVRAHEPLDALLDRLEQRGLRTAIVTDPEGRLIGVVDRSQPGS
jgi:CBS domain-containing protein